MKAGVIGIFSGLISPIKGILFLIKTPGIRKYFYWPFVLNLILSIVVYLALFTQISSASEFAVNTLEQWIGDSADDSVWMEYLTKAGKGALVFAMAYLLIIAYPIVFAILSGIITPVFRTYLYDAVNQMIGKKAPDPAKSVQTIALTIRSLNWEIRRLISYLVWVCVSFILNIVPGLGLVLQFIVTAYFLGWEIITPFFEEEKYTYTRQKRYCKKHFGAIIGFGTSLSFLLLIPFVSSFFLTAATIGAAIITSEDKLTD